MEGNLPFLVCLTLYLRAISKYKSPGDLYLEGRFNGGFFALRVLGAYIWRGVHMEGLISGILRYLELGLPVMYIAAFPHLTSHGWKHASFFPSEVLA